MSVHALTLLVCVTNASRVVGFSGLSALISIPRSLVAGKGKHKSGMGQALMPMSAAPTLLPEKCGRSLEKMREMDQQYGIID